MLSTAIAYSIAFFSGDPRVVLVIGYIVEVRFHNPICNSAVPWKMYWVSREAEIMRNSLNGCLKWNHQFARIMNCKFKPYCLTRFISYFVCLFDSALNKQSVKDKSVNKETVI